MTTHTRSYEYDTETFDKSAAMRMSGLEYMRAVVAGEIGGRPSIGPTIGMSVPHDLEFGKAVFDCQPSDFMLNPMGTVHGGFAASVLDSALGICVLTTLEAGWGFSTAELKVNYTRAIMPNGAPLRAEGTIIHRGRQMATADARLVGIDDGKLYAHASTTCFIFPLAKDGPET